MTAKHGEEPSLHAAVIRKHRRGRTREVKSAEMNLKTRAEPRSAVSPTGQADHGPLRGLGTHARAHTQHSAKTRRRHTAQAGLPLQDNTRAVIGEGLPRGFKGTSHYELDYFRAVHIFTRCSELCIYLHAASTVNTSGLRHPHCQGMCAPRGNYANTQPKNSFKDNQRLLVPFCSCVMSPEDVEKAVNKISLQTAWLCKEKQMIFVNLALPECPTTCKSAPKRNENTRPHQGFPQTLAAAFRTARAGHNPRHWQENRKANAATSAQRPLLGQKTTPCGYVSKT